MNNAAAELTLTFNHRIFYSTENPVPAEDIAEALLALSRIVHRSPGVLKRLVPGISAPIAELLVERLESGSLAEDLAIRFLFGSKKKMDRTVARVKEALGVDLTSKTGAVRTIILALLVVGAYHAISGGKKDPEKSMIEISHNTIINIGAKEMNMSAEDLVKVIIAAVPNRNQLASDSVKVIRPAKRDPNAEITVDDKNELKIAKEFIVNVPSEFIAEKSEDSKEHANVAVHLRALDLDSSARGWAAVVPTISPRRLPLELVEGINPDDLFGEKVVHGTVEAVSRRDQYGKMQLRCYRLLSIDQKEQ